MLLPFMPFHFLRSLVVQPYFIAMELSVSPFFTVWILGFAVLVAFLLVLLFEELLFVEVLTFVMGEPER